MENNNQMFKPFFVSALISFILLLTLLFVPFNMISDINMLILISLLSFILLALIIFQILFILDLNKYQKKDFFYAKTAFILSLGFWIPLFNIALCVVAVWLGRKSIKLNMEMPEKYGGRRLAIAALVLGSAGIVLTIMGFVLYILSGTICAGSICQNYLAN